jgi:hypothetical protein
MTAEKTLIRISGGHRVSAVEMLPSNLLSSRRFRETGSQNTNYHPCHGFDDLGCDAQFFVSISVY